MGVVRSSAGGRRDDGVPTASEKYTPPLSIPRSTSRQTGRFLFVGNGNHLDAAQFTPVYN